MADNGTRSGSPAMGGTPVMVSPHGEAGAVAGTARTVRVIGNWLAAGGGFSTRGGSGAAGTGAGATMSTVLVLASWEDMISSTSHVVIATTARLKPTINAC